MSIPKCGVCGRQLGEHHTATCKHWGQVVPSECPGAIESAIETVKARENFIAEGRRLERAAIVADLRARLAENCGWSEDEAEELRRLADRYEGGEHEEGK